MNESIKKHIKKGSTFKIELKGNPSTGFRWCLKTLPKSLILADEEQYPDSHKSQIVGFEYTQVFFFKAIEATNEEELLEFVYTRVWSDEYAGEQCFEITISENEADIPYQVVHNYFCSNSAPKHEQQYFVFNSLDEFQEVFSPAATMGRQIWLTKKDFEKNIVLAVVEPEENTTTEYFLNKKPCISNKTLVIDYTSNKKSTPDTTFRFSEIMMVGRGDYDQVEFIDNSKIITKPVKANDYA